MAKVKVKTITKKLGVNDDYIFVPEDNGANYKIYASKKGNEIHDASGDDSLYGGNDDDFLVAGVGNDTLSGGKGDNILSIHGGDTGNDTITLGKGTDHLLFGISNKFDYSKTGNDLIIDHKSDSTTGGKVTVKNYFKSKEGQASLKDMGNSLDALTDLNTLINDAGLTLNDIKSKKITGTYLNDIIKAQEDVRNTITTGKGNDEVTAGLGADTITIDGTGTKTIYMNKGDGDDTISFKGDGLESNVILAFDTNQASPDFADWTFEKSGNNLLINRFWTEGETETTTETTTIKDYFKYNLNIQLKKDSTDSIYDLSDFIEGNGGIILTGNEKKANTLEGSVFNDSITGGNKADKISTGSGEDEITAGKGNDKITINGSGDKTIYIDRNDGNDTIVFDLDKVVADEKIRVNILLSSEYGDAPETTYAIAKNNQDIIITNKYETIVEDILDDFDRERSVTHKAVTQTITVKNYFGNVDKINLFVDEDDVYSALLLESKGELTVKGATITGTPFDDEITGTDKSNTIYGLAGADTIIATKGNDKIYGGDGDDVYAYEKFTDRWDDGKYYTDTIYNSNGNDTISFTDLDSSSPVFQTQPKLQAGGAFPSFANRYGNTYIKNGNDLYIGAFESEDPYDKKPPMNRIILKDYFKSAKGEFGVKYIDNGKGNEDYASINLADDMVIEHSWRTTTALSDTKANKFTGTDYNDYIEGSYKQDTLKGGDGNDVLYGITSVKGKDNLYGGAGNDLLSNNNAYMYGGTGNDTYASYQQDDMSEVSNIISDEAGYDTLALTIGTYMTYFDVTLDNSEKGYTTGDMYVKDTTLTREQIIEYKYIQYTDETKEEWEYIWDENPDLEGDNIEPYMGRRQEWNDETQEWEDVEYHYYEIRGNRATEVGYDDVKDESGEVMKKGQISILKDNTYGTIIKNGTTSETAIENYTIGFNPQAFYEPIGYTAPYSQEKVDTTAGLVASWLEENGFSSVQNAIKTGTNEQLQDMLKIFKNNLFNWTEVNYSSGVSAFYSDGGTVYVDDGWNGGNNTYTLNFTNEDRYSIIDDYGGNDELILDNNEAEYSFLFDVEIDEKGNLLNYSRDFYVKFAGEEANETGIVIHDGRQSQHAVEEIWCDGDCLFEYNQATIDAVRQNVAGWLFDNGYGSVQDVLHSNNEGDISAMVELFGAMNNIE